MYLEVDIYAALVVFTAGMTNNMPPAFLEQRVSLQNNTIAHHQAGCKTILKVPQTFL